MSTDITHQLLKVCLAALLFVGLLSPSIASQIVEQLNKAATAASRQKPTPPGPFPEGALYERQFDWLNDAMDYHAAIGDTVKVIELSRQAVNLAAKSGGENAFRSNLRLASELGTSGYWLEALQIREELKRTIPTDRGWRVGNLSAMARMKIFVFNDVAGAKKDIEELEGIVRSLSATAREPEFVSIWLANLEWGKARLARAEGRTAESVAYYRGAIARFSRYADQSERLGRQYKFRESKENLLNARDWIVLELAHSFRWMGRSVEAEGILKELLSDQLARAARPVQVSATATALGYVLMNQGRWAEAEQVHKRSTEILSKTGLPADSGRFHQARFAMVPTYIGQQKWKEAYETQQEVLRQASAQDLRTADPYRSPEFVLVLLKTGRNKEALDYAGALLETQKARFESDSFRVREAEAFLAMALKANGRPQQARELFAAAVPKILDPSRDLSGAGSAFLRVKIRHIIEDYLQLLSQGSPGTLVAKADDESISRVFWLIESIRGSSVQRAIAGASARFAASDPALAVLVRNEQDLAISVADIQRQIGEVFTGRLEQAEAQKVAARMREQIADHEKKRQQALSDIAKAYPEYHRLVRPASPDLSEVAESLAPGEAFVSVYAGFEKTYVTAVLADGTVALNVAGLNEAKIAGFVKSIRRSLDPGDVPLGKIPALDLDASYSIYKSLFEPLQPQLTSAKVWTVAVSGSLGTLPLALLTTAPYQHSPDPKLLFSEYQAAPWLNKRVAIAYSPSASATVALRKLPPGNPARKAFLGIGDPQFGDRVLLAATTRSIAALDKPLGLRNMKFQRDQAKALEAIEAAGPELDASKVTTSLPSEALKAADAKIQSRSVPAAVTKPEEAIPDIPPLPDTRDEIIAIARSLGADPQRDTIFGIDASRERVMSTPLNDRRILAFATHGLIPGDIPGLNQPALTMSYSRDPRDSLLKLEDILKLKLDADWVVLSACNTGAADGIGGEAISGLGRGFFYAGSRALLVTHWPVESESAKKLVTEIFSRYSKQTSRAMSVQQAAQDLIDSKGYVDPASGRQVYSYAHPMFWAPYTLVGDAR